MLSRITGGNGKTSRVEVSCGVHSECVGASDGVAVTAIHLVSKRPSSAMIGALSRDVLIATTDPDGKNIPQQVDPQRATDSSADVVHRGPSGAVIP